MAISITNKEHFYQACSQCKKEFFDRNEFENHSCFKNGKVFDPFAKLGDTGIYSPGSEKVKTSESGHTQSKEELLSQSNENTGCAEVEDQKAVDLRLEAVKEITNMKQELVLAGIEAQTMTADETRKAYEKMKETKQEEHQVHNETSSLQTVKKRKNNSNQGE